MYPITVGLAIDTRELWEEVQASIQGLPVRVVVDQAGVDDWAALVEKVNRLRPDVLLVDISKLRIPLEDVVAHLKTCILEPMVIALNVSADPDAILQALRAGVNEYLYPPLTANLRKALERRSLEQRKPREGGRALGKVAGFFSSKGGCGATTICCHVASEIGKLGQRVLLADFDVDAGSVGFLMKAKTQYSLMDAVNNLHRLDFNYWKALVSNGLTNLEVIAGPEINGGQQLPRQEDLRHVLNFVRGQYDWTVIDLGRSLTASTNAILDDIDEAYLVTTLDVPALHRTKQIVQALLDRGYPKTRLNLVLNRIPTRLDVEPGDLQKMLGVPVTGMVPDEYGELYESYSEGKLLPSGSNLGRQFAKFASKIAGIQPEEKKKKFALFG